MASLPVDNKQPYSKHDHYRHFLPPQLHYSFGFVNNVQQTSGGSPWWILYLKYISILILCSVTINLFPWILVTLRINYNSFVLFALDEFYIIIQSLFCYLYCRIFFPQNRTRRRVSNVIWLFWNIFIPTMINLFLYYRIITTKIHDAQYIKELKDLIICDASTMPLLTILSIYFCSEILCKSKNGRLPDLKMRSTNSSHSRYKPLKNQNAFDSKYHGLAEIHEGNTTGNGTTELSSITTSNGNNSNNPMTPQYHLNVSSPHINKYRSSGSGIGRGGGGELQFQSFNSFNKSPSRSPLITANDLDEDSHDVELSLSSTFSFTVTKSNQGGSSENRFDRNHYFSPSSKGENYSNPMQHPGFVRIQSLFWIFWSMLWLEMYIIFYLIFNEKTFSNKPFENDLIYTAMLVAAVTLKWCIKRVSRILDECRITADHFQLRGSLEMMMEFICSMMYWTMFRAIIGFIESSNTSLSVILLLHFGSEWIQSTLKFTDFYFNRTKRIRFPEFWQCLNDHSNVCQWRVRLSLDVATRFNVVILSGIFQVMLHIAITQPDETLNVTSWTMEHGFVRTLSVWALEMAYYLIVTFAMNFCKFRISGLNVFVKVMQWNGRNVRYLLLCATVIVAMVYMFVFVGILN